MSTGGKVFIGGKVSLVEGLQKRESVLSAGKVPKEGKCKDYVYVDVDVCVNGVC